MDNWLIEQLKTIRNLCDIALIIKEQGHEELLPTILELMFIEIQQVNDVNCVVREDDN